MSVTAITGANWGDEGKGKMTDALASGARYVVRFQGGGNAGHTIINRLGKFALRLLPSGVFYPQVVNIVGTGAALDLELLLRELDELAGAGVPRPKLLVSDRAQLVLPYHKLLDRLEEARLGARKFGSTLSGIAPFYADKAAKLGIQAADLFHESRLRERLAAALEAKNVLFRHLYGTPPLNPDAVAAGLLPLAERLKPYVCDTSELLEEAVRAGDPILAEGQLGALRDLNHGIYPYTTSVSTLAGYVTAGAGIPPCAIDRVVAVTKAYSSSVGEGPFVSEIGGEAAAELRKRGGDAGEFGVNTRRPRRVGWFDAVATRYGCRLQGATEAALTNLDVLGYLEEIPVCAAYRIGSRSTDRFPAPAELDAAVPVLERLPGWRSDLSGARRFADLPVQARRYVEDLERRIGVPIRWISVGPRREQLIER